MVNILHGLPLCVVKCCATHYAGRHEPNSSNNYGINNIPIASITKCADLGILKQADDLYKQRIANVAAKALRRVRISLRAFRCRNIDFMHRLFMLYVRTN